MLFDKNIERKALTSESPFKSLFQGLNLYDWRGADRRRNKLEAWFKTYPDENKQDLRSRLRSGDDHIFEGAYFDLFLHELLTRLGFSLTAHPEIPDTNRRPDFLAYWNNQCFYLEATTAGLKSGPFTRNRNEENVLDKINRESRIYGCLDPGRGSLVIILLIPIC